MHSLHGPEKVDGRSISRDPGKNAKGLFTCTTTRIDLLHRTRRKDATNRVGLLSVRSRAAKGHVCATGAASFYSQTRGFDPTRPTSANARRARYHHAFDTDPSQVQQRASPLSHIEAVLRGRPRAAVRPLANVEPQPCCPPRYLPSPTNYRWLRAVR